MLNTKQFINVHFKVNDIIIDQHACINPNHNSVLPYDHNAQQGRTKCSLVNNNSNNNNNNGIIIIIIIIIIN